MSIFLIRHGETALNAGRIVQLPETPLSPHGVAQAERVAERLVRAGVARVLTSDLARARMTAERIGARTGAPVALDARLQERDFGGVRGVPYAELPCDIFAPDYVPPGGESWARFYVRVEGAWAAIREVAAALTGNLVVVTHGLVCRALVERHTGTGVELAVPLHWANCSLTELESAPPWTVRLLNCTAHLGGDGGEHAVSSGPA